MDDIATYRAKIRDLKARAGACETAAEASRYIELAVAWEKLADETEARALAQDLAEG
jgi:hypothetical protein